MVSGPLSVPFAFAHLADDELALEALRSLPAALLVVRADGTTLLANRRACRVLERARAELEGYEVGTYLAPLDVLLSPAENDGRSAKVPVMLPSDRVIEVGFAVSELRQHDPDPGQAVFAIVIKDITEVERLREERNRLLQIATVHEILPSILHEVKNPLAAIATTAELLVEEAKDEETRASAHAILHETRRMKLTVEGIGAVGRALRTARHDAIDYAMREAWAVLKARAELLGVRTRCSVPDMPLLPLDRSVVCALVFNLVNNSIQASTAGGEIELAAELVNHDRWLRIRVSDTGSGMSPDVLARCREIFFTTKARGTGIGLALCDRAVAEAGGHMEVESAPGKGTRITLNIPLEAPTDEEREAPSTEKSEV
jgi:signal transduction histidine kinase